jgi:hypothetical protein
MKTSRTWHLVQAREETVIGDLTSGFTSALRHGKSRDWAHAIPRLAQRIECFRESKTQRADYACSHNRDARSILFPVRAAWLSHGLKEKIAPRIFYCFLAGSILQMAQTETKPGSWWIVS